MDETDTGRHTLLKNQDKIIPTDYQNQACNPSIVGSIPTGPADAVSLKNVTEDRFQSNAARSASRIVTTEKSTEWRLRLSVIHGKLSEEAV